MKTSEYDYFKKWVRDCLDTPFKGAVATLNTSLELSSKPLEVDVYATGPENKERTYYQAILNAIKGAKKELVLAHMYFHPDEELFAALVKKINEGVKCTLITNGVGSSTPFTHFLYAPRNKTNYQMLWQQLEEDKRANIRVFVYGQEYLNTPKDTTYHKKVLVVDDRQVFLGSSNIGYKSLVSMADHELNIAIKSDEFASSIKKVLDEDCFSERVCFYKENDPFLAISEEEKPIPFSKWIKSFGIPSGFTIDENSLLKADLLPISKEAIAKLDQKYYSLKERVNGEQVVEIALPVLKLPLSREVELSSPTMSNRIMAGVHSALSPLIG